MTAAKQRCQMQLDQMHAKAKQMEQSGDLTLAKYNPLEQVFFIIFESVWSNHGVKKIWSKLLERKLVSGRYKLVPESKISGMQYDHFGNLSGI